MKKTAFLLALLAFVLNVHAQQPVPAKKQSKSILLMNGIAHLGNGSVIENSVIGFKDGKITLIGDAKTVRIDKAAWDTTINCSNKHVYPGFIAANSTLGLTDIESVRATNDFYEIGAINPHIRTQIAYNTDSKIPPTVRTNGVLAAQVCPRGGRISGTSSVMALEGWNWMDATLKADDGIHLNWPSAYSAEWNEASATVTYSMNKNAETQRQEMEKFFSESRAYSQNKTAVEKNIRMEAMSGIFDGTKKLYIHASLVKEINSAVAFAKKFGLMNMVIVGGVDSWKCTDLLKQNNISVMLGRTHDLPVRSDDDVNQAYKTPGLLQQAGVLFCFQNQGDMEAMGARNLPFLAGTAATWGLTKEQAVAALTGNTAKMLGIDKQMGTLEMGKDATLFISEGDALDMKTNKVTWAFVQGKKLDLRNEQQELNQLYLDKYELKK
jgi:imidazolonepropionase-like amidohydrolase